MFLKSSNHCPKMAKCFSNSEVFCRSSYTFVNSFIIVIEKMTFIRNYFCSFFLRYPLFTAIYNVCFEKHAPSEMIEVLKTHF